MTDRAAATSLPPDHRFGLVAFDMDDTLYPEVEYVRSGLRAVADHLAGRGAAQPANLFERMWRTFESGDRRRIFDTLLAAPGFQDRVEVPSLVEVYRLHVPEIHLRDDAAEALRALRFAGLALAVVTDGPAVQQKRKADALGLAACVDAIVFTDELGPGCGKPSPAAFELLMRRFAVTGRQCTYVADNPRKDFPGPRQLGWYTVQYLPEAGIYRDEPAPPGGAADACVTDLRDVLRICGLEGLA